MHHISSTTSGSNRRGLLAWALLGALGVSGGAWAEEGLVTAAPEGEGREELEPIETDRPHLTDTPHTVPPGHLQFETEVTGLSLPRNGSGEGTELYFLDAFARYGIGPGVDLEANFRIAQFDRPPEGPWGGRFGNDLLLRAKLNLWGGNGPVSLTLTPVISFSLSGQERRAEGGGILMFGIDFPSGWELEANLSILAERDDAEGHRLRIAPTIAVTREVVDRLAVFLETYNEVRPMGGPFSSILATGVLFEVTHRFQLDAGVRVGLTPDTPLANLFLGAAYLL